MVELRLKGGGEVPIADGDTVAVGVVDIAGAGVRAMLAMRPPGAAALELELTGIPASADREGAVGPTFGDDVAAVCLVQPAPGVSLIAVNRPLSAAEEAPFAHALASLVTERRAPLCIVAGALRLNVGGEGVVFQHAVNGAAPLDLGDGGDGVNRLPGDLPIADGAIAACIHSLRHAGVPAVCALTHGYRVAKLGSAAETEAAAAAARLGTAVAKGLGCAHDGRDLGANYVWQPDEVAAKADQMYN